MPQTGVYQLIVDNSEAWLLPRQVQLYVYSVSPTPTTEALQAEKTLDTALGNVGKLFIFPSFKIQIPTAVW